MKQSLKRFMKIPAIFLFSFFIILCLSSCGKDLSPLHVEGTKLVDSRGKEVQLKGISTHGINWFPDYVNEDLFRELHENWGADIVRLSMYTASEGGYCTGGDQENLKSLIDKGVQYCTENQMYVIIDWHVLSDGNPNRFKEEAKAFFTEMSEKYRDHTNVLYEICNEPNNCDWAEVKAYAEEIIPLIRANDPDALVLVGTPSYCKLIMAPTYDPLDFDNVMYDMHFYAENHQASNRNDLLKALDKGLPVFITEYGICNSSGTGENNPESGAAWTALLDEHGISSCMWNLSNKDETCALIRADVTKVSGFEWEDLSESGQWLVEYLTGKPSFN